MENVNAYKRPKEAENYVKVEGILNEIKLEQSAYFKNGERIETAGGYITVRVSQEINGVMTDMEIPVHYFSPKYKKDGGISKKWETIMEIMQEGKSIAAHGVEEASRVRITGANLLMNEYYKKDGTLASYPRVQGTFFQILRNKEAYVPEASFRVAIAVVKKGPMLNREGVPIEPQKYSILGAVPLYGQDLSLIKFVAYSPALIDFFEQEVGFEEGKYDTLRVAGKINFSIHPETVSAGPQYKYGEGLERTRNIVVNELVILGSSAIIEGELAYDTEDINNRARYRLAKLEERKNRPQQPKAAPASPKQAPEFIF